VETRELGQTGVEVTRIALGCGNFGGVGSAPALFEQGESREEAFAVMDAAWELGIRLFDSAASYGGGRSERWIGEWMADRGRRPLTTGSSSRWRRSRPPPATAAWTWRLWRSHGCSPTSA